MDEPHMLPCGVCSYCECDLVWDDMVGHGERNVLQTVQQCEVHLCGTGLPLATFDDSHGM